VRRKITVAFAGKRGARRAEFDKHLDECPWCVAYLDSYRKTILLGKAAFADSEDAPPPPDALEELIEAILHARFRAS
jgi:anti-sigma factor RsiW